MILNFPTGLYIDLDLQDNVTWFISNNEPKRVADIIVKIPTAEEIKSLPRSEFDREIRRQSFGELIYTISEAMNSDLGSSTKIYAEGDVLEFRDDSRDDLGVARGDKVEFKHNNNELDLSGVGFDDDDIKEFNSAVYDKKSLLEEVFLSIRTEIADIEINIIEVQKNINESTKALNAVNILGDELLIEKVEEKLSLYEDELSESSNTHTIKTKELDAIVEDLNKIDMVAK